MSGQPGPSSSQPNPNGSTTPKAIANLAKRQDDVTRRGTSKMKFTPILPLRRKKEESTQPETKPEKPAIQTGARGRGTARGRGRGDARGGAPRPASQMIATGPLALGPTMSGSTATKRSAPRSNFSPATSSGAGTPSSSSIGAGLTRSTAPTLKREPSDSAQKLVEVEAETYSDPDDGVEIVDIDEVRKMDWMAPESLRKERTREKKKRPSVKREASKEKGKVKAESQDVDMEVAEEEHIDLANALDLSESEEEEELEDIFSDFALQEEDQDMDSNVRQEKLYFFQFPEPFPTFLPRESRTTQDTETETPKPVDKGKAPEGSEKIKKAVTFAPDVKPPASGATTPSLETPSVPIDGVIGRLEIHQSGAVGMRLENGILLNVTAATQPSFLQHAVHVDMEKKKLRVIGEVNRRFVVSPDIDALLESLEVAEHQQQQQGTIQTAMDVDKLEEGLIKMEEGKKEKPRKKAQKK